MHDEPLPPLNSVVAFEAAGRHQSFLYAAAELDVSPGAVSRHVRQLEQFLGTQLFVRQSSGVTLTSAGNRYARKMSRILRDLRRATAEVRKADIAARVADRTSVSKTHAQSVVCAVLETITDALGRGESLSVSGFGTFSEMHREARQGRILCTAGDEAREVRLHAALRF